MRDILECREVDHDVEAELGPEVHDRQHDQGLGGVLEKALARQPHRLQSGIHDPEVGIEDEAEQQALGRRRRDERHQEAGAVEADELDLPVQQDRHSQPGRQADRQVHQGEEKRVRERLAEHRVLGQSGVVREPDEVASR